MVLRTIFPLVCVALILHSCEALFLSPPDSTCRSNSDCQYLKCIHHSDYALCNLGSKYEIILQLREYQKDLEYRLHHHQSKFDRSVFLILEPISYFLAFIWLFFLETTELHHDLMAKGQLIPKCVFSVIVWTKKPTKFFPGFLPQRLNSG